MAESEPATIDALFRSAMSDWRTKEHASLGESIPVVVRREALLTLYWKGQAHAKTVTGQEYELLQRISHYPLASFLFAHQGAGRSQADVEALLSLVRAEVDGREALDLDGSVWSSVEKVQAICGDLLQQKLKSGSLRYEDVETFSEELSPLLTHFIEVAAEVEVRALQEALEDFAERVPTQTWLRAHFVVCGGRQPRYKNITKAYFEHYLGESGDPNRRFENQMIYCEGVESDAKAMEQLANHLVNQRLGRVFFGSPLALEQDVLGDAARHTIRRIASNEKR